MDKKVDQKEDFSEQEIGKYLAGELGKKKSEEIEMMINQVKEFKNKFFELKKIWEFSGLIPESKLINKEHARLKVMKKIHGFARYRNFITYLTKIAAILFLPLLVTSIAYLYYTLSFSKSQDFINEINVSYGTVTNFVLSDGTIVWLNSGSHFKYPAKFHGASREVYLEGEAYFEVSANHKPFIVKTSQLNIEAKGTSFNVLAYPGSNMIQTTLIQGEINYYKINPDAKPTYIASFKKNEKATYFFSDKSILIDSLTSTEKYTAWKDGKLIFHDDPFEEVIRKLSRWYNTDIQLIDPELKAYHYTATFTDETLLQVLELLKNSAPVTYNYTTRSKNMDGTFSKRMVEIRIRR